MNKKAYIKPELMIEELETQVLMFSGSLKDTEVNTDDSQMSIGRGNRRGTWGNLWATEE